MKISKNYCSAFAVMTLVGFGFPLSALPNGTLNVQKMAVYDKDLAVPQAVQTECNLESKIPEYVQASAKGSFDSVGLFNKLPDSGRNLTMKIIGLSATGGGAWSGPKTVTVSGEMTENGKVIGTFKASRHSGGGAFGGYKGTCSILDRCAKTLGKDIAQWASDPTMNAHLGELK